MIRPVKFQLFCCMGRRRLQVSIDGSRRRCLSGYPASTPKTVQSFDVQTKFEQFCSNAETKLPNTFQVKEAEVENHINKYILPGTIVYKQK
uniref:Uncharacterized protein n=1 Tax=Panagrolaimus sp. JU765 TaxID=591449 RepID=A0AC34RSF2_9BILA